jgi:hypothetical protein
MLSGRLNVERAIGRYDRVPCSGEGNTPERAGSEFSILSELFRFSLAI